MTKIKKCLYLLVGIGSLIAGAPTVRAATERPLKIALIQEWSHLNPITFDLASVEGLLPFVTRAFVARSASGAVLPDVAETVPSLSNKGAKIETSGGRKHFVATWKITSKAKWGDGVPVTCADFKLSWQIGSSSNVQVQARNIYSKIAKIEWQEKSPQKCVVTYANEDWSFDRDIPSPVPAHLEAAVFEKYKGESQGYDRNSNYVRNPTNPGLYNGPYLVSEFKLGSHFIMTPNPHFYGEVPEVKKIIVTHISDSSALRAHLLSRQVDAVGAVGFPADVALSMSEEFDQKQLPMTVRFQDSAIFQGIFMNLETEVLKDLRVRQALALALDKEALAKAFFKDKILPANTFVPVQHPAFKKRASEFSREKARRLLDEASWKMADKGLRSKDGKALTLQFKVSAGIKVYENLQQLLCDQFKQVGVGCEIKNEPPRVLLGDSVPKGQFELVMFGQPIPPDSSLTAYFSSGEIPSSRNAWAGQNVCRWKNEKLDKILAQFDSESDSRKRNQLIAKMEEIYLQDRPFIPLYHRREAMVIPRDLMGVQDDYNGTGFVFPEKWKWKK
jgi:peptide/nickel transport system substrate-binding protein